MTNDEIKACESVIRSCDVAIAKVSTPEPGWEIERDRAAAFISAAEAVHLSVPDLVDLVIERLSTAAAA